MRRLSFRRKKRTKIYYYNNGKLEEEKICPERWMRLIYENPVGGASLLWLVKRKALSRLYGLYCKTPMSARGISRFIKKYHVDMTGCKGKYKNFAQFFSRERQGIQFPKEKNVLGTPCEGLVSAFDNIQSDKLIQAKGMEFSMRDLFGNESLANEFDGGTMVRIRLTPANYHRMHFFDKGTIQKETNLKGHLYSVSPLALNKIIELYCRNKRAVIEFETENFGKAVMVEVGATFVGSIVHCFKQGEQVDRGQLASYFKPGGSLVLVFFKKGTVELQKDILEKSKDGFEVKMPIGEPLGQIKGIV